MTATILFPNGGEVKLEIGYVPTVNDSCWLDNKKYTVADVEHFLSEGKVSIHLIDAVNLEKFSGEIPKMKWITPNR